MIFRQIQLLLILGYATDVSSFTTLSATMRESNSRFSFRQGKSSSSSSLCSRTLARFSPSENDEPAAADSVTTTSSRRQALHFAASSVLATTLVLSLPASSNAFDNKISTKYDDRPKRRGPLPKDLGVRPRKRSVPLFDAPDDVDFENYVGLKACGAAPNCFSSSIPLEEEDPDHTIPAWEWPTDRLESPKQALEELMQVVQSYPPGQNGVDGGGFAVQTVDYDKVYAWVIFEALKNGYYDDVEFAVVADNQNQMQVRSSSRIGYLDLGVNAKRLNWIAKALRSKGWKAEGVNLDTHRGYALENQL